MPLKITIEAQIVNANPIHFETNPAVFTKNLSCKIMRETECRKVCLGSMFEFSPMPYVEIISSNRQILWSIPGQRVRVDEGVARSRGFPEERRVPG